MKQTYINLNAQLNLYDENGRIQFGKDKEAARAFFLEHVNPNTVFFHTLEEKIEYLTSEGLWDKEVLTRYTSSEVKALFQYAYGFKFRFPTYLGAYKFYAQYALKTPDGERYLERYEDRVVLNALAYSEDYSHAKEVVEAIIEGRFQPATPTFLNAGRANSGDPVSCFLLRLEDNMESVSRAITDSLQLSKRGGGVALLLSNIREAGAPIKKVENQSSGVIPIMKLLEDSFSYANQLGQRQGAGAVYLNAHHPDIMAFLDTKRENADEKVRIKTLSLGVVIPDITFQLARENKDMYLFSPYDVEREEGRPFGDLSVSEHYHEWVENPNIRKTKINARKLFQTLAEVQFESGYPYIMFEDTSNNHNPVPNVGRINMSNLCSEISQPNKPAVYNEDGTFLELGHDISCNLGSLNVAQMVKLNKKDFSRTVEVAYRFLNLVATSTNMHCSPSVLAGNSLSRAIGLGQMNLHGCFIEKGIDYDSEEARLFWGRYMADVTYCMISASNRQAFIKRESFFGFEGSRWQDGSYIRDMIEHVPEGALYSVAAWESLRLAVIEDGLYNQHLQAIPPTGSISYINNATSSIHPIASKIEIRKEGKVGRVYYPAYGLTNENFSEVKDAYEIGYEALIDMYAISAKFVDQGQSLTLFFKDTATTRDLNKAQIYAHRSGVKSIYYVRLRQDALTGTEVEGCVSCQL